MAHQKKRQLDYNPVTGETEWYHYDSIEDKFTLEKMQDIEPILIANKEQIWESTKTFPGNVDTLC